MFLNRFFLLLLTLVLFLQCTEKNSSAQDANTTGGSIFDLTSTWENQNGEKLQLKDLQGKNLVITMIFTRCQTACPLLVQDMKNIQRKIDSKKLKDTQLVLISVDPENDTPDVLHKYAEERALTGKEWLLLRSDMDATRELANVLAVKYKKISPIIFSHSNIISVLNRNGELVSQEEGTVNAAAVAAAVNKLP